MKFSAVTLACMVTGVVASPPTRVFERDLAAVTQVLSSVGSDIDALSTAVQGFSGDAGQITSAGNKLVQTLKDGETKVQGSSMLDLTGALGLQQPVKDLQTKAESLVSQLKSKKSTIQSSGLCGTTRGILSQVNTNSQALIKTVVGKVPTEAQSIAQNLANGLSNVLSDANTQFSTSNCQDKGGASSSAPASSAPASSAPASSGGSSAPASSGSAPASSAPASMPASSGGGGGAYPVPTAPASNGGGYSVPANSGGYATATGGMPSGGAPTGVPVVTGAAPLVAPAGVMAVAMAAILL